ncbi:MAG: hypothetical protein HRU15_18535 [Planctomycetes bacterium]|nr:hypothetical protein [Planctomycetota bacterium]
MLLFSSCGEADLHIDYGSTETNSINGIRVLKSYWADRFKFSHHRNRSSKLDQHNLIFHFQTDNLSQFTAEQTADGLLQDLDSQSQKNDDGTEEELNYTFDSSSSAQWIRQWLTNKSQRQFVFILRDGTVTQWLCQRWAKEFTAAAQQSTDVEEREKLLLRAHSIKRLAARYFIPPRVAENDTIDYELFTLTGHRRSNGSSLDGLLSIDAPPFMNSAAHIDVLNKDPQQDVDTLFLLDGKQFALSIPIAESRLIILSNATPLLDASLVDKNARQMLYALSDYIDDWIVHDDQFRSAWLQSTRAQKEYNDSPSTNIISMLFSKKPFNYLIIHGIVLIFAYLLWKARWLGKRNSNKTSIHENFDRHIDSLAWHLSNEKSYTSACSSIAEYHGHDDDNKNIKINTEAQALAYSQRIICPEETV